MTLSGIPGFNFDDLTDVDDNNYYGGHFGFDNIGYLDPSNFAGPSLPYAGVDILGDLNDYPDFPSAFAAPTSLYPANGACLNKEYNSSFDQGGSAPSFSSQPATTPYRFLPYPSHGLPSLPLDPYAVPITPSHSCAQPQVIPGPYDPSFGFPTAEENFSLPAVLLPQAHTPPYGQPWHQRQCPRFDAFNSDISPLTGNTGATPHEIPPQRTRQSAREGRKYNPVKPTKKPILKRDGWDKTLARFRTKLDAKFDTLQNVRDGQPSGGLVPEMALAEVDRMMKEDLKRSPLRDFTAGEGKRSRNMEKYLEGLLQAIRPVEPTSTSGSAGSDESCTTIATLSRHADELEGRLVAVNPQPMLRQSPSAPGAGTKTSGKQSERLAKRSKIEKERRDWERRQLERMTRLFKVPSKLKVWSRKDVLSLAVLFLLYGPTAFPLGFIEVRPDAQTL